MIDVPMDKRDDLTIWPQKKYALPFRVVDGEMSHNILLRLTSQQFMRLYDYLEKIAKEEPRES